MNMFIYDTDTIMEIDIDTIEINVAIEKHRNRYEHIHSCRNICRYKQRYRYIDKYKSSYGQHTCKNGHTCKLRHKDAGMGLTPKATSPLQDREGETSRNWLKKLEDISNLFVL